MSTFVRKGRKRKRDHMISSSQRRKGGERSSAFAFGKKGSDHALSFLSPGGGGSLIGGGGRGIRFVLEGGRLGTKALNQLFVVSFEGKKRGLVGPCAYGKKGKGNSGSPSRRGGGSMQLAGKKKGKPHRGRTARKGGKGKGEKKEKEVCRKVPGGGYE